MQRLRDVLLDLPLATFLGGGFGLVLVIVGLVVDPWPSRPLAALVLAPVCAVGGAWIDWARRWRPAPRVARFSAMALLSTIWLGLVGALDARSVADVVWVPMTFMALAAIAVAFAASTGLGLAAARRLGWRTLEGRVRRDDTDRLVVDTREGTLVLPRDARELGPARTLDLAPGRSLALLVKASPRSAESPYRSEDRRPARALVAGPNPTSLRRSIAARARAWAAYLAVLAMLGGALGAAAAHQTPDPDHTETRGLAQVPQNVT